MYLKAIELHGFKSFPDKTRISFDKGMTAVIGPNGSGKSNISDAIRWVLGETSGKELRSAGKMEDIIFGGAKQRGPMGFASVSLILDNSDRSFDMDSDEVSVTRKYYRGGDGEYFINGSRVRLKDIYELFLDTGLGKSGYSIVGQGKISQIVTAKPENRREIFEEASGISKFRYRKNEAEKKLAGAQENIVRLSDILLGLEERVGPLEKESKKAKEYLRLAGEKKGMEISLWLQTVEKNKALIREQQRKMEIFQNDHDRIREQVKEKENYIEESFFKGNSLIAKGEESQIAIRGVEQLISEKNSDRAVWESQSQYDEKRMAELAEELEMFAGEEGEIQQKKADFEAKIETLTQQKNDLEQQGETLQSEIAQLVQQAKQADQFRGSLVEQQNAARETQGNCRVELASIESQNETVLQSKQQAEQSLAAAEKYLAEVNSHITELQEFIGQVDEGIRRNNNIKNGINMKLGTVKDKLEKAEENQRINSQKQRDTQHHVQVLVDMENSMDGFYQSVKDVLSAGKNGRLRGIIGTVSQVIGVQKGYETAIETALGNSVLQDIIVQDETGAKQAIEYLKTGKKGRATFLPLDTVKPSNFSEKLPEWATTADRVITADSRYGNIISNLLGRTIITEDINLASRLAKQLGYRYRIVTMDGQQINAGGSFTGGSVSKSAGLFTRKGEIEKGKNLLEKLKEEQKTLEEETAKIRDSHDLLVSQIEGCDAEIETLQNDRYNCSIELTKYQQQANQYRDSITLNGGIVENADAVISDNLSRKVQLTQTVAQCEKQLAELARQIASLTSQDESGQDRQQALSNQLQQIKLDAVQLAGEILLAQSGIQQLGLQRQQADERKQRLAEEIRQLETNIADRKTAMDNAAQEIDALRGQIADLEQQIRQYNEQRQQIEKERIEAEKLNKDLEAQANDLSVKIATIQERIINMETGYDDIIQRLWEEYNLTVQTAREFAVDFEDEAQLRKDLAAVKAAIKQLGNVNVKSIDEYREVYEKYNFLKEQLRDLEDSRQQLQKLITSLNGEMKTLFSESFGIINDNFGRIFRQLFGGGSASLTLTEPDNILESGVDIQVNPPGKVIKSLTALSGGEQALVAISIYFAILAHNPSPFCILDEIEAALDDANVTRYANYLHDISNTTQFIVITHRRGTMESADVLYGVTMQEDGISKLLKLDVNNISPSMIN
ncbi:MAG: chromosome segregation protein SMC [Oscillospiraceae bacterium]|nr:chromosome segregation protein SMC [Oscillospiraceae bacterium]